MDCLVQSLNLLSSEDTSTIIHRTSSESGDSKNRVCKTSCYTGASVVSSFTEGTSTRVTYA